MPRVLIEKFDVPSYEIILWFYQMDSDCTIQLDGMELNEAVVRECVLKQDFEFYKWFTVSCRTMITYKWLAVIYEHGMLEHIKFTEEMLTLPCEGVSRREQASRSQFAKLSTVTPPSENADPVAVVVYVEWLIGIGRMLDVQPPVLASFVEYLVFHCVETNEDTVKHLLYVSMMYSDSPRSVFVKTMFDLMRRHASMTKKVELLVELMGAVGLFSTSAGRAQHALLEVKNLRIEKFAIGLIQPNTEDAGIRYAIDVLRQQHFEDGVIRDHLFVHVMRIDKKSGGSISRFGMVIFKSLFRIGKWSLLMDMILKDCLMPPTLDPSLISELTSVIFMSGEKEIMTAFHQKMTMIRAECRKSYISAANNTLFHVLAEGIPGVNVELMMKLLDSDLDISDMDRLKFISRDVSLVILQNIKRKPELTETLLKCGDRHLRHLVSEQNRRSGIAGILEDYQSLIGQKTWLGVLKTYHKEPLPASLRPRFFSYLEQNSKLYLQVLLTNYSHDSLRDSIIKIHRSLEPFLHHVENIFIIGSQSYNTANGSFFKWELMGEHACRVCKNKLGDDIFHDSAAKHGEYTCETCKEDNATTSRATCNVCLSDEKYPRMRIAGCGHTYCDTCLTKMMKSHSPACPMCRRTLTMKRIQIPIPNVIDIFMKEYTESREATRKAFLAMRGSPVSEPVESSENSEAETSDASGDSSEAESESGTESANYRASH